MTTTFRLLALTALLALMGPLAAPVDARAEPYPDSIDLPDGFFPEGITIDDQRGVGYTGSLVGGAVQRFDLRTGESFTLVPSPGTDTIAVGMTIDDQDRLWVAGGGPLLSPSTEAGFRVYDSNTGELLLDQPLPAGFVNDAYFTGDAVWFTDSFSPNLIRVPIGSDGTIGAFELVSLGGDWVQSGGFNANGITATADGKNLIVVQSSAPDTEGAALYLIPTDPAGATVDAVRIMLDQPLVSGDGLVLVGRTLYVVGGGVVSKVRLGPGLSNGQVVETLAVPGALTPTTADAFGSRLYVIDAKFPLLGDPSTGFAVSAIDR